MAIDICLYFQVHQPWRLRTYRFLEVGRNQRYFDEQKNEEIFRKVAARCYEPMNQLVLDLINEYKGQFKVAFSITGTVLQQMEAYAPETIDSFKKLFDTGCVELLSETSHHSLASLHSPEEFREQIEIHREICSRLLVPPSKVFRNTELIASNEIAQLVDGLGFEGLMIEGADQVLRWRSPLFKYRMAAAPNLVALTKNYRLSDDISFRFSDRGWAAWPLTSEKYTEWIKLVEEDNGVSARGDTPMVGLFMDYETFGEHHWAATGIFDFMKVLPGRLLGLGGVRFVTPSGAVNMARTEHNDFTIDAPQPFSWADIERDLSAWEGNSIQDSALRAVYRLEKAIKAKGDPDLLETWRRLLSSDHFYYMCTKYFSDGDAHKYFNPFDSPYDAHIIFMNVIADMERRCGFTTKEVA